VLPGVLAVALLTVMFAGALNVVVDEYCKGALRTAVDEAAQAGADNGGSLSSCQSSAKRVMGGLLPGRFGSEVRITCSLQGHEVVATASGHLSSFVPPVPALPVSITGYSVLNPVPGQ